MTHPYRPTDKVTIVGKMLGVSKYQKPQKAYCGFQAKFFVEIVQKDVPRNGKVLMELILVISITLTYVVNVPS